VTVYSFDSITAAQALAITTDDRVDVPVGTASQTTVLFNFDGSISVVVGARTVVFGAGFNQTAGTGHLVFADGSQLYLGTAAANGRDFGLTTPGFGAIYAGDGDDMVTTGAGAWLVQGNQGNDQVIANLAWANTIYGGQGNDFLQVSGLAGPVDGQFLQGNKGDDNLIGAAGQDTLLGGQGNDTVLGNNGVDFINGNLGNDNLSGMGQLFGEDGTDSIFAGSSAPSTVHGGEGDDSIGASALSTANGLIGARTVLFGDGGNDTLTTLSPEHDELFGGAGDDSLRSTSASTTNGDLFDGGDGNDSISARAADDTLSGGVGDDSLAGDAGNNSLSGGDGNDYLSQQNTAGNNVLDGGEGNDTMLASVGQDTLTGGGGNDRLFDVGGGDGNLLIGGAGDDTLGLGVSTGPGTSSLLGGDGNDLIDVVGADSRQVIDGGAGVDSIRGTRSGDTISGGLGNDTIDTAGGSDVLTGGGGADRFIFLMDRGGVPGPGTAPQIRDWGGDDLIQFRDSPIGLYIEITAPDFTSSITAAQNQLGNNTNAVVAVQVAGDVIVFYGGPSIGSSVVLVGRSLADVSGDNFV